MQSNFKKVKNGEHRILQMQLDYHQEMLEEIKKNIEKIRKHSMKQYAKVSSLSTAVENNKTGIKTLENRGWTFFLLLLTTIVSLLVKFIFFP